MAKVDLGDSELWNLTNFWIACYCRATYEYNLVIEVDVDELNLDVAKWLCYNVTFSYSSWYGYTEISFKEYDDYIQFLLTFDDLIMES